MSREKGVESFPAKDNVAGDGEGVEDGGNFEEGTRDGSDI